MKLIHHLSIAERFAALAGLVAAVAALAGFIPGVYRDPRPLIVQSNGQDLATLVVAIPVLALGLWASSRGSLRGRLVVLGALGLPPVHVRGLRLRFRARSADPA